MSTHDAVIEAATTSTSTPTPDPGASGPARGHSAATLHEAAVAELGPDAGALTVVDPAISATWPGARVAGLAYTVQGAGGDNLALHHAIAAAPAHSVLVADLGGAAHGHWGEVMAVAAQQRAIAGLVIDGGVRDAYEMAAHAFPVFSRNNTVRGTRKLFPGVLGGRIRVGGVLVHTGDLIVGDADGVVVIPAQHITAVLDRADVRAAHEVDVLAQLRAGATTLQIYALDDAAPTAPTAATTTSPVDTCAGQAPADSDERQLP